MIKQSCSARTIPIEFYGTGEDTKFNSMPIYQKQPSAFIDKSADVLTRNLYSVNTKAYEKLRDHHKSMRELMELNKERNNYLNPTYNYITKQHIPQDINYRHYQFQKAKAYSKEIPFVYQIEKGQILSENDYCKEKEKNVKQSGSCVELRRKMPNDLLKKEINSLKPQKLEDIILKHNKKYEKNHNKNIIKFSSSNNKISHDAPQWMKIKDKRKSKGTYDKNDTIAVFSRFNQWITLSPKSRSRNQAFEKQKYSIEKQTKIRPKWMHSTFWDYNSKKDNLFIAQPYVDFHSKKPVAKTILIDKESVERLKSKSVFSYGDSRHNVPFASDVKKYEKEISRLPKQFFY